MTKKVRKLENELYAAANRDTSVDDRYAGIGAKLGELRRELTAPLGFELDETI